MAKGKAPRIDWETLARTQMHPLKMRIIELSAAGAEHAGRRPARGRHVRRRR